MSHLTLKERELYTKVFLSMDEDGNGWLSMEELKQGCRGLGFHFSDEEGGGEYAGKDASFNAIDGNQDGRVTLDEFLAIMGHIEQTSPRATKEAQLRRSFREIDKDGDGLLTEKELMDGLRHAGYNVSREQIKRIVRDLDINGDGKLCFEEFIRMFKL